MHNTAVAIHAWSILTSVLFLLLWWDNRSDDSVPVSSFFCLTSGFLFLLANSPTLLILKKSELLSRCGTLAIVAFIAYTVAVLFGAPIRSDHVQTAVFSCFVTNILVPFISIGRLKISLGTSTDEIANFLEEVVKCCTFTVAGAWLGAVVIPLDWDRPWQVWPEPCCVGALLGSVADHLRILLRLRSDATQVKERLM